MNLQLQLNNYFCGPASIKAALHSIGLKSNQHTIAAQADTTKEGTDVNGMLTALSYYPVHTWEIDTNKWREAWGQVEINTANGYPTIICVDNYYHWVTVIGKFGDKFLIFDPQRHDKTSGITFNNWRNLHWYWRAGKTTRNHEGAYYGITIVPDYQSLQSRICD